MILKALGGQVRYKNSLSCARNTEGQDVMSEMIEMKQTDEEIFFNEVSDEALETTGVAGKENAFTLGACSGLSVCPG